MCVWQQLEKHELNPEKTEKDEKQIQDRHNSDFQDSAIIIYINKIEFSYFL